MNPNANLLYSWLLFISSGISIVVMVIAWRRRRDVSSARPIAAFSFSNALWGFFYALHWTNTPRVSEFFWLDMTYFGVVVSIPAFLIFALYYTGLNTYLTKNVLKVLFGVPLLTLFFLWTDPWLGVFFAGKRLSGTSVIYDGGFGFWFFTIYSYGLVFLSTLIILQAVFRFPKKYQGQAGMIFFGIFLPVLTSLLTFVGLSPLPELDLTPITFSLTGVAFTVAIFRYDFLDLMPVSRDVVFETHRDAIFVLDLKHRIVEANEYAREIFIGESDTSLIGRSLSELRRYFPTFPYMNLGVEEERLEFAFSGDEDIFFEMQISPLYRNTDEIMGYIVTFHDISGQKKAEKTILETNRQLRARLEKIQALQRQLREEAIRDHLTGLYNRRYLHEILLQYLGAARKRSRIISFALLDIDHFKQINDTYGHDIGDEVLVSFSKFLVENTRHEDSVCRFGGEEFMVVFLNTSKEDAVQRVKAWRKEMPNLSFSRTAIETSVTFSAGVVTFPEDGENMDQLFKKADNYLYEAKHAGRNRVFSS